MPGPLNRALLALFAVLLLSAAAPRASHGMSAMQWGASVYVSLYNGEHVEFDSYAGYLLVRSRRNGEWGGYAVFPNARHVLVNGSSCTDIIDAQKAPPWVWFEVYAGDGHDFVTGGPLRDILFGGDGDDDIAGGPGDDIIFGESGEDELYGGRGDDQIWGGSDSNKLWGGDGFDLLIGGDSHDQLSGGADDCEDWLFPGAGPDTILMPYNEMPWWLDWEDEVPTLDSQDRVDARPVDVWKTALVLPRYMPTIGGCEPDYGDLPYIK